MYYKAKVKCKVEDERGKMLKVTEEYLVEAISVTDVEAKITEEYQGSTYDSWELVSVTETKIDKVLA